MLSTSTIIQYAKISQYLAANAIKRGIEQDTLLANKIYTERISVQWDYTNNPTDTTLVETGNYLIALCGAYFITAQGISGSGGSVVNPSAPSANIPYQLNITITAGQSGVQTYTNTALIGATAPSTIFINQSTFQLWDGTTGEYTFNSTIGQLNFSIGGYTLQTNDKLTGTFYKTS